MQSLMNVGITNLGDHRPHNYCMTSDLGIKALAVHPTDDPTTTPPDPNTDPNTIPNDDPITDTLPINSNVPAAHSSVVDHPTQLIHLPMQSNPDADAVNHYNITPYTLHQVYFSPHWYGHASEESFAFLGSPTTIHPTAGLELIEHNCRVLIDTITAGNPCAKLPRWRTRLRGGSLIQINDSTIASIANAISVFSHIPHQLRGTCRLLISTHELRDGLTAEGIPQIGLDQLNPHHFFNIPGNHSTDNPTSQSWDGGDLQYISRANKHTQGLRLKQSEISAT